MSGGTLRSATARQLARIGLLATGLLAASIASACPGDCDGNREVTIDELVLGVRLALEDGDGDACSAFDGNDDGRVAVNELVAAVAAALTGCPTATPAPTQSPRPTTSATRRPATASATPSPTATAPPESSIRFIEASEAVGLDFAHQYLAYRIDPEVAMMMGGATAGDFDGDGRPDLFVLGGDRSSRVYRNRRDGIFVHERNDVPELRDGQESGPTSADLNGDGHLDLFIGGVDGAASIVLRNAGDGIFEDESNRPDIPGMEVHTLGAAFADVDGDEDIDRVTVHWGSTTASVSGLLWRNDGDGGFSLARPGIAPLSREGVERSLSALLTDLDADGDPDLLVAGDGVLARFDNAGDGSFVHRSLPGAASTTATGIAVGDYDNDADLDVFFSGISDPGNTLAPLSWNGQGNRLYRNRGDGELEEVTDAAGMGSGGWGWSACFADFDNDGDLDLLQTGGFGILDLLAVGARWEAMPEFHENPVVLFVNDGDGTFTEGAVAAGINDREQGRAALCFDADLDGDIDVLLARNGEPLRFYRNESPPHHGWIAVDLENRPPNTAAVGARITVETESGTQVREVRAAGGFAAAGPFTAHFGLADDSPLTLRVRWPDGEISTFSNLLPRQHLVVRREGAPVTRTPRATLSPTPTPRRTLPPRATATRTSPPTRHPSRTPTPVGGPDWIFREVSAAAGVDADHSYLGNQSDLLTPQFTGGVAAGDYDRDGWVDLFVTGGDLSHDRLYRNRGDGTFADVGESAGVAFRNRRGSGPTFADLDGDGWLDLFIGGVEGTPVQVLRNRGNGTFVEWANTGIAFDPAVHTFGAGFGDYDRDGDLDAFLTHWNSPASLPVEHLWRNDGAIFVPVDAAAGISGLGNEHNDFSFAGTFSDIDDDGWPDLLVTSDFGTSQYLLNRGDGTFRRATTEVISDENGMGSAIGDYDGDGDLDWFVTSIYDPPGSRLGQRTGNRLYRNEGNGVFSDATDETGVRIGWWGWAACRQDFDNDGWLDLFHVNGMGRIDYGDFGFVFERHEPFTSDPALLFVSNGDGTFRERAGERGIADRGQGRGVVCFDYDRDGDIDVFIFNNGQPARLYRNDLERPVHFLAVRLEGRLPNSQAIGARIILRAGGLTQLREIRAGSNYVSQDPAIAHFGLGSATLVDELRVRWPDGSETVQGAVTADQYLVIEQQ